MSWLLITRRDLIVGDSHDSNIVIKCLKNTHSYCDTSLLYF